MENFEKIIHAKWELQARKPRYPLYKLTQEFIDELTDWWYEWKAFIAENFPHELSGMAPPYGVVDEEWEAQNEERMRYEALRAEREALRGEYDHAMGYF